MSLGFSPHSCANIIGFNSAEWFIAYMGAIAAGGIMAGIYTSNLPEVSGFVRTIVVQTITVRVISGICAVL